MPQLNSNSTHKGNLTSKGGMCAVVSWCVRVCESYFVKFKNHQSVKSEPGGLDCIHYQIVDRFEWNPCV